MTIIATVARTGMTDHQCRARRLARERAVLAGGLLEFLEELPDGSFFDFNDLRHLAGYRNLEPEGLVHAGVIRPSGCITILVAASRVLKRPDLRARLFALRRLAGHDLKRVIVVGPRGLQRETARLRARRVAGLAAAAEY